MKSFFAFAFLFFMLSCKNKKEKEQSTVKSDKKDISAQSDTFNLRDPISNPALQKDISLDTIRIDAKNGHANLYIVFPILSAKEYPGISTWLDKLIIDKKNEFSEDVKADHEKYDSTSGWTDGWDMYLEPRLLYRSDSLLSFAIEEGGGARGMPAGFNYQTINFDFKRKKEITWKNYFIFKTYADSVFLENLITRAIGHEFLLRMRDYLYPEEKINFSFDNNAVYFLFDKYDPLGWGIYSVEKKYILEHINPAYQ